MCVRCSCCCFGESLYAKLKVEVFFKVNRFRRSKGLFHTFLRLLLSARHFLAVRKFVGIIIIPMQCNNMYIYYSVIPKVVKIKVLILTFFCPPWENKYFTNASNLRLGFFCGLDNSSRHILLIVFFLFGINMYVTLAQFASLNRG